MDSVSYKKWYGGVLQKGWVSLGEGGRGGYDEGVLYTYMNFSKIVKRAQVNIHTMIHSLSFGKTLCTPVLHTIHSHPLAIVSHFSYRHFCFLFFS